MTRALIIGFGSPLRGDDAFGWHAANRLRNLARDNSVQVLATHQLTPELAEPISEASLVIFIDASNEGELETWRCEEITTDAPLTSSLAHHFTPRTLLGYARTIYGVSPRALLVAFASQSFDCCETLTPRAEAALAEVVKRVLQHIS